MFASPATPVPLSLGVELERVGLVKSITTLNPVEALETFPAASVAFAVIEYVPPERVPVVQLKVPEVAVHVLPELVPFT